MYLNSTKTKRLFIRPLSSDDISGWAEFFRENESLHFFNLDLTLSADELSKRWIERQLYRYKESLFGLYGLETFDKKLTGQCGLLVQEIDGKKEIEIGYHVLPRFWGQGLALEAAKFFKDYAFSNSITNSLISIIHVDNFRSQRVAEKNGMVRTVETKFQNMPVFIYRIWKGI